MLDLQRLDVTLALPYDTGDEPGITIEATKNGSYAENDQTEQAWDEWKVNTFPPDVSRHFVMFVLQVGQTSQLGFL